MTTAKISFVPWFLAVVFVCECGCRSVPPPKRNADFKGNSQLLIATNHVLTTQVTTNQSDGVFVHFPKESQKFSFWTKCNPAWWFGNADDPVPPENYRKGKCCRQFMWHMRNPCHNFTFYVMGIEDKAHVRVGKYPAKVANPNGGWNWAVCQYKRLRLPFVDYQRGRFEFYCGWRNGGNFGMKLNLWQGKKKPPPPSQEQKANYQTYFTTSSCAAAAF